MKRKNDWVIYTAIFGNRDSFNEPKVTNKYCDYICFTDQNIVSNVFKIIKLDHFFPSYRLDSRFFKIMSHVVLPQYKYSIWIDGSVVIKNDPYLYYKKTLNESKIALFSHYLRNCIYKEARACIRHRLDRKENILNQTRYYRSQYYPKNNGLFENGIVGRVNCEEISNINTEWWNEIRNYSSRDQISLPYVLWKNKIKPAVVPGTVYINNFFEIMKHLI